MLPIDGLCARPAELGADKSRGLSNRLQFDTHSVLIVRDDLERQRRGVMQYGDVHHVIIDLKSSAVERGRDFPAGRKEAWTVRQRRNAREDAGGAESTRRAPAFLCR
jgi:hypothetical protein